MISIVYFGVLLWCHLHFVCSLLSIDYVVEWYARFVMYVNNDKLLYFLLSPKSLRMQWILYLFIEKLLKINSIEL